MIMAKLIYISGKIGEKKLSKATIEKFRLAQERLLAEGWNVINPTAEKFQQKAKQEVSIEEVKWKSFKEAEFDWYAWLLLWDLHSLALCDAIYMLKDWKDSNGATVEYYFAKACGKDIIFEEE